MNTKNPVRGYKRVFQALGLPKVAFEIHSGRLPLPNDFDQQPPKWYGFPPALIPLWSDWSGPVTTGLWKHWFVDRRPTYVDFHLEVAQIYEKAATLDALLVNQVLQDMDEEVRVTRFAQKAGLADPKTLKPPRKPSNRPKDLNRTCPYEYSEEELDRLRKKSTIPAWFKSVEKQEALFNRLLAQGDLGGAWMSLNSSGWKYRAAQSAILRLAKAAGDQAFTILAQAWSALGTPSRTETY